jgi:hypothetical protein
MLEKFKAGTQVQVAFSKAHKQQYPNYCAAWEGRTGVVLEYDAGVNNRGFVRVLIAGHTLCIERENLLHWRDLKLRIA